MLIPAVTPHAVVYAPLALIVPLVDAEYGVGQGVVTQELALGTLQPALATYNAYNTTA